MCSIKDGPISCQTSAPSAELLKQSDKIKTLTINSRGGEIGFALIWVIWFMIINLMYKLDSIAVVLVPIMCLLRAK